ncbi:hypothetical protein A2635_02500 [Candidatus Peribacteria bacterium RIFCSPHIGHO2_01_FULL_51_9]|nr:MAG: hypothetical protein A2635_02500 [Candidatus Peribacteria bacterium RIFCSPHIGHO2_01_FULL_51_9]
MTCTHEQRLIDMGVTDFAQEVCEGEGRERSTRMTGSMFGWCLNCEVAHDLVRDFVGILFFRSKRQSIRGSDPKWFYRRTCLHNSLARHGDRGIANEIFGIGAGGHVDISVRENNQKSKCHPELVEG